MVLGPSKQPAKKKVAETSETETQEI
jgi:hypothetical protein